MLRRIVSKVVLNTKRAFWSTPCRENLQIVSLWERKKKCRFLCYLQLFNSAVRKGAVKTVLSVNLGSRALQAVHIFYFHPAQTIWTIRNTPPQKKKVDWDFNRLNIDLIKFMTCNKNVISAHNKLSHWTRYVLPFLIYKVHNIFNQHRI